MDFTKTFPWPLLLLCCLHVTSSCRPDDVSTLSLTSPVVLVGKTVSVSVNEANATVEATFVVQHVMKGQHLMQLYQRPSTPQYIRLTWSWSPPSGSTCPSSVPVVCPLRQFVCFVTWSGHAFEAAGSPVPVSQDVVRTIRRTICKGCAFPPSITSLKSSSARLNVGKTLRMRCVATGNPKPSIVWTVNRANGNDVVRIDHEADQRAVIVTKGTRSTLRIFDLQSSDSGRYSCVASNTLGTASRSASVAVSAEIRPVLFPRSLDVTSGASATLTCSLEDAEVADFVWFRDGRRLEDGREGAQISTTSSSVRIFSTLRLLDASSSLSGLYECHVMTPSGVYRSTVSRVKVKPAPSSSPFTPVSSNVCPIEGYCLNGASCSFVASLGEMSCSCQQGFSGRRCEVKYTERSYHVQTFCNDYPC